MPTRITSVAKEPATETASSGSASIRFWVSLLLPKSQPLKPVRIVVDPCVRRITSVAKEPATETIFLVADGHFAKVSLLLPKSQPLKRSMPRLRRGGRLVSLLLPKSQPLKLVYELPHKDVRGITSVAKEPSTETLRRAPRRGRSHVSLLLPKSHPLKPGEGKGGKPRGAVSLLLPKSHPLKHWTKTEADLRKWYHFCCQRAIH